MTTPAGWYPDTNPGVERYWNGEKWMEHTRPLGMNPAPPAASKADVKAQQQANKAEVKAQQQASAQAAKRQAAFDASPVGMATRAREQGQGFFEIQLIVGSSQRDSTIFGGNNFNLARAKTVTHAGTLAAIEAVGWHLEHVGHVFVVTSESSRDKFLATGQQTAVSGHTMGIYLFRAVD